MYGTPEYTNLSRTWYNLFRATKKYNLWSYNVYIMNSKLKAGVLALVCREKIVDGVKVELNLQDGGSKEGELGRGEIKEDLWTPEEKDILGKLFDSFFVTYSRKNSITPELKPQAYLGIDARTASDGPNSIPPSNDKKPRLTVDIVEPTQEVVQKVYENFMPVVRSSKELGQKKVKDVVQYIEDKVVDIDTTQVEKQLAQEEQKSATGGASKQEVINAISEEERALHRSEQTTRKFERQQFMQRFEKV